MPHWCSNSIAFYQEDKENDRLRQLADDIRRYVNYKKKGSDRWIGALLEAKGVSTENMRCRAFVTDVTVFSDHVQLDMESAWRPLPTVHEKIAELYNLKQVYVAEEISDDLYVNTDLAGTYFGDRYVLDNCEVDEIKKEFGDISEYESALKHIELSDRYFSSLDKLISVCEDFHVELKTFEDVKEFLGKFGIKVCEYERDDSGYKE